MDVMERDTLKSRKTKMLSNALPVMATGQRKKIPVRLARGKGILSLNPMLKHNGGEGNMKHHWTEKLVKLGACSGAVEWCRDYKTFKQAWDTCNRLDWLLWLIYKKKGRKVVVRLACQYARLSLPYTTDPVAENTIETVEAWIEGKATVQQVRKARLVARGAELAARTTVAEWIAWAAEEAVAAAWAAEDSAGTSKKKIMRQCFKLTKHCKINL